MRLLQIMFFIIIGCVPVYAANHFIHSSATGSGTGNDWTNAWTDLPTVFVRGDTYYVADGLYGSHKFSTPLSGDQYIVIKKATVLDHGTSTGWSDTFGDGIAEFRSTGTVFTFESGYWILDGQVGEKNGADSGGAFASHGFKATLTGTSSASYGVNVPGDYDGIQLHHIEITAPYYNTVASSASQSGVRTTGADGWIIAHSYIHSWATNCIIMVNSDNNIIEHNWLEGSHSTTEAHGQAIYLGYTRATNWEIKYNTFHDINGSAVIFFSGAVSDVRIHGNLFWEEATSTDRGIFSVGGIIGHNNSGGDASNNTFYNNTVVGFRGRSTSGQVAVDSGTGNLAHNNLWWQCNGVRFANWIHDFNAADISLFEQNGKVLEVVPFLGYAQGEFSLQAAIGNGIQLAPAYRNDMTGTIRGADGIWDIGAFELNAPHYFFAPGNLRILLP